MKKMISLAILLSLAIPTFAQAKVTLFSNSAVINKVVTSTDVQELEDAHGDLKNIEIDKVAKRGTFQSFNLKLTFTQDSPIGEHSCFVDVKVDVVKNDKAPAGIEASTMKLPKFSEPICER